MPPPADVSGERVRASSRLLKKAHLRRWHAGALAAAYRKYAWTQLRWVPRPARAAWHLDLFEQPERKRVFQQPTKESREMLDRTEKQARSACPGAHPMAIPTSGVAIEVFTLRGDRRIRESEFRLT